MKIRAKERLATILVLAIIGLIAALVWWTYEEVDVANRERQQASEIARGLSQLRLLTFEYRLYHNERAKVQWHAVSNRLDRLIADTQISIPTQDRILASIRARRVTILQLFTELASAESGPRADAPLDESTRLFEGTLFSRLLAEEQDTFTDVFRLTDIATGRINEAQWRLLFVTLAGLLLVALTMGFASWLINHDVLAPIVRLQRATREIGAGNWNFRLDAGGDDELGRLGTSFNSMVERIEAQATALQRAHDELELRVQERTAELVQSNKSVQTSEARMAGIVNSAMDAIIGIDAEQKIVLFNATAERMFHCSAMAAIGQPIDMIVPQRFRDQHRHHIGTFGKTGITSRSMLTLGALYGLRADGEEFPIEASISQIEVSEQKIFTVILRDITERQRSEAALRESEIRLETIVENLSEGVAVSGLDGQLLNFNRAALELHGFSSLDECRRHLSEFADIFELSAPGGTVLSVEQWPLSRVLRGENLRDLAVRIRRTHDARWERVFSYGGTLVHDANGQPMMAVVTMRDITEREQAAEKILQLNADLEQRVLQRTAELEIANKELEAFSYSVSHDLRAPLRSMDGFSLALIEDYGDKLDEEAQDALKRIRAASQRMGDLIDDLLRLSQVARAELNVTRVDLSALAREIADGIDRDQSGRCVDWEIESGLSVRADLALMRIAMQNLLRNAWKFTGRTNKPVIRVGALERDAKTVYFVADNGVGFDMAHAHSLFGAFQRLHHVGDFPGTGIGLAIVQRIIRRHGGKIWAEAKEGEGATFYFSVKESENGSDAQANPAG